MELGLPTNINFDLARGPGSRNNSKLEVLGLSEESSGDETDDDIKERDCQIQCKTIVEECDVDDVFNDSLPNINSEDFAEANDRKVGQVSKVAEKVEPNCDIIHTNRGQCSSDDIQDMLIQLIETSMDISESAGVSEDKENCIPKSRIPDQYNAIMHSTPGNTAYTTSKSFARNRLSSIAIEEATIGDHEANDSPSNIPKPHKIATSTPKSQIPVEDNENMMETSLNISEIEHQSNNNGVRLAVEQMPSHHKLSDSDVAAALAIANDSKFDSEDMFADFENVSKPVDLNTVNAPVEPQLDLRVQQKSNSSESELPDAAMQMSISTQETSTECESSVTIFEKSSEIMETSSYASTSRNGSMSARDTESSPTPLVTAGLGFRGRGRQLKVIKILTPEFLPKTMFQVDVTVSLGINIASLKRSTSIARTGIGSKIIGPRLIPKTGREHSLVLYDGGNTLWKYNWTHTDPNEAGHSSNKKRLMQLFRKFKNSSCTIALFDAKYSLKQLMQQSGNDLMFEFPEQILDPKIAQWMLLFDEDNWKKKLSVKKMSKLHLSSEDNGIFDLKWGSEIVDAFVAWHVMNKITPELKEQQLWKPYIEIEMPSIIPILLMEMNGFGQDSVELNRMKIALQYKSAVLEIRAFQLAGSQFNLSSPKHIQQVLFKDLGLKRPPGSKGTSKDVLSKLDHELPKLILEWRKIASALTKDVIPFQEVRSLDTHRVHGYYSHFNVTGRIVMKEPSIQCIPRDFDLHLDYSPEEIEDLTANCKIKFGSNVTSLLNQIERARRMCSQSHYLRSSFISLRNVFIPCCNEFVLLSADYSQLELRILAHLCQDKGLLQVLNSMDGDVFISIASKWKNLPLEQITTKMRQEAKGIVYGVIYGMGAKTLSEQMEIDVADASRFITEFMRSYPGIQTFLDTTVNSCRQNGFIETISGRRRYLPNICSNNPTERAQAERQAVNSQIQGSAADLMKTSMSKIHTRLGELFPRNTIPINWAQHLQNSKPSKHTKSSSSLVPTVNLPLSIVYIPVLNLHDELIFEVRSSNLQQISDEIRALMESSIKFSVRTPVVIKVGNSWGSLKTQDRRTYVNL